ncbi:MAG: FAD-dependent oxidoreductase [Spirochaetota bacterium]|nr:FAD-dependent oxidoreductase [Spirochaetota bacterium]
MIPKEKYKERRNAVLLVGSGYGPLKVAEDLAQSGIPVVWVTREHHFLKLSEQRDDFIEFPGDLNYQFRPLYLRVTRHPLVTPLTQSKIVSITKDRNGFKSTVVLEPQYINYNLCIGCGKCMEVCPLNESENPPLMRTPSYCPSRALELDKRMLSSCRIECPLNINVQAYMAMIAAHRFDEALAIIRQDNPLPGICGRVCHHPCEVSCRRGELDDAVAIRALKRFLADYEARIDHPKLTMIDQPRRSERVAVIGSGPGGLTAAYHLNCAGFPVTVFEALSEPGGMLRYGINAFRLPRSILKAEIDAIIDTGVDIKINSRVESVEYLFDQGYSAVLLCIGAHCDLKMNIPGEDALGVLGAVKMLRTLNLGERVEIGRHTAVIGGGNSAIDAARTAIRLGSESVTIYYRRERSDMPADENEIIAAEEEGVHFEFLVLPVRMLMGNGRISALEVIRMQPGEPDKSGRRRPEPIKGSEHIVNVDTVITAIGQRSHLVDEGLAGKIQTDDRGRISVDARSCTSWEGVFAAGDAVTGPLTVIESMAGGRRAAYCIIEYLTKEPVDDTELTASSRGVGDYINISEKILTQRRPEPAQRQPKVRRNDFEEVEFGLTEEQAIVEAKRCLQCGLCCECRACETACGEISAIDHFVKPKKVRILSPGIIIADEDEMNHLSLDYSEGIYHIDEDIEKNDLLNLMIAGSSLAGQAMVRAANLRESAIQKIGYEHDVPRILDIGVFLCTCNGTMASPVVLNQIMDMLAKIPQVKHSELIVSCCHPKGAERIAKSFKKHRLTRGIVASCVCCPLEFQCISCNDQRTRARIHLFDTLKLERSQFEMINLKDNLNIGNLTIDEMMEFSRDMLRNAFIRTNYREKLHQGFTEISNNILILGGSEIGINCAINLDQQDFRVRLVHQCRLAKDVMLPEEITDRRLDMDFGRSIDHVKEAVIEEIKGHIGDFTVIYNQNGKQGRWQADMICLTDNHLLSLAIQEEMMGLKKIYRYNFSFFHTPQPGFYRIHSRTLERINAPGIGTALAAQVAKASVESFLKDHELSPRIDVELCRGCGRCKDICPFGAIKMVAGPDGIYHSEILRHNCVGCGGCVGRCPVTAMDMPYYSNKLLTEVFTRTLNWEQDNEKS